MKVKEAIKEFEGLNKTGFDEHSIVPVLKKAQCEIIDNPNSCELAELMAFDFCENYIHENGWGTYFGPNYVGPSSDGGTIESPSIQKVNTEIIEHWEKRAMENINPILRARYSGLVWDFKKKITGVKPNFAIGKIFIENLAKIAEQEISSNEFNVFQKLQRALSLSISFKHQDYINRVKVAIINYEDKFSEDSKPGLWGYAFSLLVNNEKVKLTPTEESKIIFDLESRLNCLSSDENSKKDPWAAKKAANSLGEYYVLKEDKTNLDRVVQKIYETFFSFLDSGTATQAIGWLEELNHFLNKFGFKDLAQNSLLKIRELGPKSSSELQTLTHSFDIPKQVINSFLEEMTKGSIKEILTNLSIQFIPNKEREKEQLLEMAKQNPFTYMIGHSQIDDLGRVVSKVGSISSDIDGHLILHISKNLQYNAIFLNLLLNKLKNDELLTVDTIVDFLKCSPVLDDKRIRIIQKGLEFYLKGDFLMSIHLLVPQIEYFIRKMLELAGGIIVKPKDGSYQLKTLDAVLRDPIFNEVFGEGYSTYLRIILTDQRGWNLRNNVCHGISSIESFNVQNADRLLHVLLTFGLMRKKEK